jgi:DNA-binding NtrC family response regulator
MYSLAMFTTSNPTLAAFSPCATVQGEGRTVEYKPQQGDTTILGESEAMQRLRMQVRRLGPHFRIVLLRGEAGTGKTLTAHALHAHSSHAAGPLVPFDCARSEASADELIKALKAAHRGTIYLPRVNAMQRDTQATLINILKERDRVLSRPIIVHGLEARIIASSIEDLRASVARGGFLQELYHRISSVTIELTPLRERREDIPIIARHFLEASGLDKNTDLNALRHSILSQWIDHQWPGNVKELRRTMQQVVEVRPIGDHGTRRMKVAAAKTLHVSVASADSAVRLQDVVEQHVLQVLKDCSGNKVRAAEVLGISRSTLYRMLESGLQGDKLLGLR